MSENVYKMLLVLINHVKSDKCVIDDPRTYIGYKEVHEKLGLQLKSRGWGNSLIHHGLDDLAKLLKRRNYPAITGLIVDKEKLMPSEGYFKVNKKSVDDRDWWENEIEKSKDFDWFNEIDSLKSYAGEIVYADDIDTRSYFEGAVKKVLVNTYERNEKARYDCIEHFGSECYVCGFSFEKTYGERFKGYIHVHHIVPISTIGKEYKLNAITDLRPVCPNCHNAIHTSKPMLDIEEMKLKFMKS